MSKPKTTPCKSQSLGEEPGPNSLCKSGDGGQPVADKPETTETDGELLKRLGDDATKWAAEFRKCAINLGYSDMDEGWLTVWFANAIENSYDLRTHKLGSVAPIVTEIEQAMITAREQGHQEGFKAGKEWAREMIRG